VPKRTRFTAIQDKKMLDYRFPTALQMVLSVAMAEQLEERSTSAILASAESESELYPQINGSAHA
jgi:Rrf2 family transcriptional repressor of oqxAB